MVSKIWVNVLFWRLFKEINSQVIGLKIGYKFQFLILGVQGVHTQHYETRAWNWTFMSFLGEKSLDFN